MVKRRILIFGAGVIGSTFGGLLALSGNDVTLLARNNRLKELKSRGLILQENGHGKNRVIPVDIISELKADDIYDFVLVTLRKDQVSDSLAVLGRNQSKNIVFMVNNPSGYDLWTEALGAERVMAAFPGAGGKITDGIVFYEIVSGIIQPTTIGELNGKNSERIKVLRKIFESSGFTVSVSGNMDAWQKTHVAMVGPLGDVIYYDGGDNYSVAKNRQAIRQMNLALKENFKFLHDTGLGVRPYKLNIFRHLPLWFLNMAMRYAFNTRWAETVICNHALNARSEMKIISDEFLELARSKNYTLKEFERLAAAI